MNESRPTLASSSRRRRTAMLLATTIGCITGCASNITTVRTIDASDGHPIGGVKVYRQSDPSDAWAFEPNSRARLITETDVDGIAKIPDASLVQPAIFTFVGSGYMPAVAICPVEDKTKMMVGTNLEKFHSAGSWDTQSIRETVLVRMRPANHGQAINPPLRSPVP